MLKHFFKIITRNHPFLCLRALKIIYLPWLVQVRVRTELSLPLDNPAPGWLHCSPQPVPEAAERLCFPFLTPLKWSLEPVPVWVVGCWAGGRGCAWGRRRKPSWLAGKEKENRAWPAGLLSLSVMALALLFPPWCSCSVQWTAFPELRGKDPVASAPSLLQTDGNW